MSFSGYFSFKKIPLKLSHSSANISGEDERQWERFNIVIRRNAPRLDYSAIQGSKISRHCT